MEHYRSVFATAAAIVVTLVTASHVAYPRNPEESRQRTRISRSFEIEQRAETTWTEPTQAHPSVADAGTDASSVAPRLAAFAQLPAETERLFSTPPAAAPANPAARPTAKRYRAARPAPVSARTANATQTQTSGDTSGVGTAPERSEKRVDLIGDLLKNLGIGREG